MYALDMVAYMYALREREEEIDYAIHKGRERGEREQERCVCHLELRLHRVVGGYTGVLLMGMQGCTGVSRGV